MYSPLIFSTPCVSCSKPGNCFIEVLQGLQVLEHGADLLPGTLTGASTGMPGGYGTDARRYDPVSCFCHRDLFNITTDKLS